MSEVSQQVPTSAARVWEVLADGWSYAAWVVGASHIRDVGASWPAVGARLHHSVGPWPLVVHDYTEVVACVPREVLELRARLWPAGEARVKFTITPAGADACRMSVEEHPTRGPAAWAHNPVFEGVLNARNVETLRRLADLAEGRQT